MLSKYAPLGAEEVSVNKTVKSLASWISHLLLGKGRWINPVIHARVKTDLQYWQVSIFKGMSWMMTSGRGGWYSFMLGGQRGPLGGNFWAEIWLRGRSQPSEGGERAFQALGWEGAGRTELYWGVVGKAERMGTTISEACKGHALCPGKGVRGLCAMGELLSKSRGGARPDLHIWRPVESAVTWAGWMPGDEQEDVWGGQAGDYGGSVWAMPVDMGRKGWIWY